MVGSFLYALRFLVSGGSYLRVAWQWLREGLLLLAATCTLALPGMSLTVYRDFNPDKDEWDLSPIPTLLGKVDPRRFYTFSLGQGSMAANAFYDSDVGKKVHQIRPSGGREGVTNLEVFG